MHYLRRLATIKAELDKVQAAVATYQKAAQGADRIGFRARRVIGRPDMGKHFELKLETLRASERRRRPGRWVHRSPPRATGMCISYDGQ